MSNFFTKDKDEFELPLEFKETHYTPKLCSTCSLVSQNKRKYGIILETPYSYLLLEGCFGRESCTQKNLQIFTYGIRIHEDFVRSVFYKLWDFLVDVSDYENYLPYYDQTVEYTFNLEDYDYFVSQLKACIGFVKTEKEVVVSLPQVVRRLIHVLIHAKVPGFVVYPISKDYDEDVVDFSPELGFLTKKQSLKEKYGLGRDYFGIWEIYYRTRIRECSSFSKWYVTESDLVVCQHATGGSCFLNPSETLLGPMEEGEFGLKKKLTQLISFGEAITSLRKFLFTEKREKLINVGKLVTKVVKASCFKVYSKS